MMKNFLIIQFILTLFLSVQGQSKIIDVANTDSIQYATLDRAGDLYVINTSGIILKYSSNGKLLATYRCSSTPTVFDTGNGVRLLSYYRTQQAYDILNPILEKIESHKIDSAFAIDPWLICPSGDYNMWILDASDWSLKKIDPHNLVVLHEFTMDPANVNGTSSFTILREYQGFLFLLDQTQGILIFNGLGKHLRTIPAKGLNYFNFLGEELYFKQSNKLKLIDIFTLETRELQLNKEDVVLLTDENIYSIDSNRIKIDKIITK